VQASTLKWGIIQRHRSLFWRTLYHTRVLMW